MTGLSPDKLAEELRPLRWYQSTDHPQDRGTLTAHGWGGRYSIEADADNFIVWMAHDEFTFETGATIEECKAIAEQHYRKTAAALFKSPKETGEANCWVPTALRSLPNGESRNEITDKQVMEHHRYRTLWEDFQTVEKDLRACALLVGHHYNSLRPVAPAVEAALSPPQPIDPWEGNPAREGMQHNIEQQPIREDVVERLECATIAARVHLEERDAAREEVERLREALELARGCISDLRRGFAPFVDPKVEQTLATIDAALSTPTSAKASK